ncbi:c-type cytochrome [Pigmentiphaga soli]|uniref:C-type cytochrome n=1 Tax=Pigmentiphaga soli TaxID=1007095 RepID=A0ABP8H416_9BURK
MPYLLHPRAALVAALCAATAAGLPAARAAGTGDGLELARSKNCLGCHQLDTKRVGPAYRSVAQRFAGDPGAVDKLQTAIRKGSIRQWGAVPMPAQTQVTEAEARQLAQWILSLK